MDLENAWNVALKDFKIYKKKTSVIYATVALPFMVGVAFPFILNYSIHSSRRAITASTATTLMDSFSLFFLIGAMIIPTAIASYSLVGEKIQKSLEPMLATPIADGDILLGKTISALIIPVAALYAGSAVYMGLMNYFTQGLLGYSYYPNWDLNIILLAAPLASLLSVEVNVLISSRMNDVRSAQQLGMLAVLPFFGLFFASEFNIFPLNNENLAIIGGAIGVIDIVLFYLAKATFRREEILTSWR